MEEDRPTNQRSSDALPLPSGGQTSVQEASRAFSTQIGYVNAKGQEVLGPTGESGTDHGQSIYVLRCQRCAHEYGANGSDIAIRRCPNCDAGRRGFDKSSKDVVEITAQSTRATRNPQWTRDELILALDVYFQAPAADERHPKVIELSKLMNRLWARSQFRGGATLRNPAGVSMKLGNFQRLDPRFQDTGRKGLAHGSRRDEEIWLEFAADRDRLSAIAAAIRNTLEGAPGFVELQDLDSETEAEAAEGAVLTRLHHYRERDRDLPKQRRAKALEVHGRLFCEACGFDFAATYGERGAGYMEVHHTRALETLKPGEKTKLSELAVLCANCHRMVHAKRPWLTMDQLKALVRKTP